MDFGRAEDGEVGDFGGDGEAEGEEKRREEETVEGREQERKQGSRESTARRASWEANIVRGEKGEQRGGCGKWKTSQQRIPK